ncbi:hypothetical protein [Haloferula rosea]|uniref:Uncharacterized protein n=1 Tax=Haloferula rosea TaxID=490093 RepID=A0A934RBV3_9BACT|nr:hypothetical protein [Haloferula rosea]MBK1826136.1 hypothetical protein [Haloferula rosea]
MKSLSIVAASVMMSVAYAAEVPEVLNYLPQNQFVKGATTVVVPPKELDKYVAIVEKAAQKDPEWFKEHSKKSAPGIPLPYDPKLGLTEEQYKEYLALWEKREFKAVEPVVLQLKEAGKGFWSIVTVGGAHPITTLKYDAAKDVFVSPNGTLERLEDVDADKHSILGAWTGHEWKFSEETSLGSTKENFAIGKTGDGKFGLLVYRMQEVSSEGTRLYDKSLVIRFPMGAAGILKPEELQLQQPRR